MNSIKAIVTIGFLLVYVSLNAQTTTYSVDIVEDSYIDQQYGTTNYGSDTIMKSGTYSVGAPQYLQRVYFDIDLSGIPAGAYVANAKVHLVKKGDILGSNPWRTYRVDSNWDENSITEQSQPSISTDVSTVSSVSGDTLVLNVATIVNQMHLGLMDNYGLCLQVLDERDTSTTGGTFYTSNHPDASKRPWLEITYYYPMEVSNVQIKHASTDTASDGSIGLEVLKGTEGYTYEWIDGATGSTISTDSIIDSLDYGWYGLHVTGSAGDELYQAFMVGVYCDSVDITFQPSGDYTNYAYVYDATVNGVDYSKVNFGNSVDLLTSFLSVSGNWVKRKAYIDFNLWLDDRFDVKQADLTLQGKSHIKSNWRLNKADLFKVTELWDEEVITYNNQPDTTSLNPVLVDSVSTTTQDRTVDISGFWEDWKANNNSNYGMMLALQDFTSTFNVKQHYHSPNNGTASNRPSINFRLDLTDYSDWDFVAESWDDDNEVGEMVVDIHPICTKTAPFKYIVLKDSIPHLDTLYKYINDSVYGGMLDSTDFYQGTTNETSMTYSGLESGSYYVYVYDATGDHIVKQRVRINNSLNFDNQTNLAVVGDTLKATQANGIGSLEAFTYAGQNSGFETLLTSSNGEQFLGLLVDTVTVADTSDIVYGFNIKDDTLQLIVNGVLDTTLIMISSNANLELKILNGELKMYVNGTERYSTSTPSTYEYKFGAQLQPANKLPIYFQNFIGFKKKFYVQPTVTSLANCTDDNGSFNFYIGQLGGYGSTTVDYTVYDQYGAVVSSSSTSTYSTVPINNVPAGAYTIVWNYLGMTSLPTTVWLGYETTWDDIVDYNTTTPNTYSLTRPIPAASGYSTARSENYLYPSAAGWLRYIPKNVTTPTNENTIRLTNANVASTLPVSGEEHINTFKLVLPLWGTYYGTLGYFNPLGGLDVIHLTSNNSAQHLVQYDGLTSLELSIDGITNSAIYDGTLGHTFRAITKQINDGFENVISSYTCPKQPLSTIGYTELKRELDTGFGFAVENTVKFTFDEEYDIESAKVVAMNIYDNSHELIWNIQMDGTPISSTSSVPYTYDDIRVDLDVTNLSLNTGEHYIVEVVTSKNDKLYMRFLYKY